MTNVLRTPPCQVGDEKFNYGPVCIGSTQRKRAWRSGNTTRRLFSDRGDGDIPKWRGRGIGSIQAEADTATSQLIGLIEWSDSSESGTGDEDNASGEYRKAEATWTLKFFLEHPRNGPVYRCELQASCDRNGKNNCTWNVNDRQVRVQFVEQIHQQPERYPLNRANFRNNFHGQCPMHTL